MNHWLITIHSIRNQNGLEFFRITFILELNLKYIIINHIFNNSF